MAMPKGARVVIDVSGLRRAAAQIRGVPDRKVKQAVQRTRATLARSLRAAAARQVAEKQLNLPARAVSPYIRVDQGSAGGFDYVAVTASNTRLPLQAFRPKVSKTSGVTVTTWLDSPAKRLPHAFARPGKGIWQRTPARNGMPSGPSGLVHRTPVVARKGPSLRRTLQPAGPGRLAAHRRDDVVAELLSFGRNVLAREIERQLAL